MNPLYGYSSLYPSYGDIYTVFGQRLSIGSSPLLSASSRAQGDAYQLDLSAYGQLMSSLSSFQYALDSLHSANQNNTISAASSNTAVATASAGSAAQAASYNLSISQLAQAETLASGAFSDSSSTVLGSGTLSITTGAYQSASNSFIADGSVTATITINNGTLDSIASAINASGVGVIANVQQGSGGYFLSLTRSATGAASNMQITVADSDGNNTNLSGLSQLAYDPTAASGSGRNMSLAQIGKNAFYTLNGVNASNSSNNNVKLADSLSANLLQTGSTVVSVGIDAEQLSSGTQRLATAFNALQASVNQLQSSSSALQNDSLFSRLISDLNFQAITRLENNSSTLTMLPQIGLRYQAADNSSQMASLSLDNNALQDAYQLDQNGAANLLSLSSTAFNALSKAYSDPGNGALTQTMNQLQQWGSQYAAAVVSPQGSAPPYSMAAFLAQASNGATNRQLLSAQQVTALAQYSMVLAMSQPVNVRSLQNRAIDPILRASNSNGISVYA
jgi:flagellar hook-associated protein 2